MTAIAARRDMPLHFAFESKKKSRVKCWLSAFDWLLMSLPF
jgi:hypothetical protein